MVPLSASNVTPPLEFNVTVVPASSAVPSAVIVILAAAPAVSVVVIVNAPLVPAVNTAVSSVSSSHGNYFSINSNIINS